MTPALEFARLSWCLLERKFVYYVPGPIAPELDSIYDDYEARYRVLAAELGVPPTAADMVGFSVSRPACRLVKKTVLERGYLTPWPK